MSERSRVVDAWWGEAAPPPGPDYVGAMIVAFLAGCVFYILLAWGASF